MFVSLLLSLASAVILIQAAVFSTTIFLHRSATHRALVLHPAVALLFRAVLWITTGISTREWVAVHRKHHAFTDEEGDPHSPYIQGNTATNLRWLALVTAGEGLHNNHHGFPRSPKFSLRASEIDPAWPFIRLLAWLRLARPYRTIPQVAGRVTAALRPELPQVSPDFAE